MVENVKVVERKEKRIVDMMREFASHWNFAGKMDQKLIF